MSKTVLLLVAVTCVAAMQRFDGHKVLRIQPETAHHVKLLETIEEHHSYDFWKSPSLEGRPIDVRVAPEDDRLLERLLTSYEIKYSIMVPDVQVDSDATLASNVIKKQTCQIGSSTGGLEFYQTYDETIAFTRQLALENSDIARIVSIGFTRQGREVIGIEIDISPAIQKPGYFIDGGIHAREWISPATVKNVAIALIEGFRTGDPLATRMLNQFQWTIVPILNADGYDYTWTTNRLWRKNRAPNQGSTCIGVDLNRNSNIDFTGPGSSNNPCSDAYRGPSAFSEPELFELTQYIASRGNVKSYWNFHSYGQDLFIPWGYTNQPPPERALHQAAANDFRDAIRNTTGETYYAGPDLSTVSGDLSDFIFANVPTATYSGVAELRDTGRFGFQLPADQICPTSQEIFAGLAAHSNFVFSN